MSYKSLYGEVTLKNGLTACEVAKLYSLTDIKFEIGDTVLEFEDDNFDDDALVEWLTTKEVVSGDIEDCGSYDSKYNFYPEDKQWGWYQKEFMCDLTDDTMIDELKLRGYTVTKGE